MENIRFLHAIVAEKTAKEIFVTNERTDGETRIKQYTPLLRSEGIITHLTNKQPATIKEVDKHKLFDLYITEDGTWNNHVDGKVKKLGTNLIVYGN